MKKIYTFLLTLMLFITGCGPTAQPSSTTTYTEQTSQSSYMYGETMRLGDVFPVFDILSTQDINFFARENYQENDTHLAIISKEYMTDVSYL